jgi:hypothetical protein
MAWDCNKQKHVLISNDPWRQCLVCERTILDDKDVGKTIVGTSDLDDPRSIATPGGNW